MDLFILVKLAIIILLVTGNAFFVGSEIALTSARRSRIQHLVNQGDAKAMIVQTLHSEPERFYSVTQIGITVMSLALGAIGIETVTTFMTPLVDFIVIHLSQIFHPQNAHYVALTTTHVIAFVFISFFHIVGGELAPKVYAFHRPVRTSLRVARVINGLYRLLFYAIWLLNYSSNGLLKLFGQKDLAGSKGGHLAISEDELRTILSESESDGILKPEESAMIQSVFELEDHSVDEVMIPRTKIVSLHKDMKIKEFLKIFQSQRHNRYPVYNHHMDDIVGILSIKEVLSHFDLEEGKCTIDRPVSEMVQAPYIIPETKDLKSLLADFKSQRQQMAIAVDEFGGTAGLITLEDILEEVVGEYEDEFSAVPMPVGSKENDSEMVIDPSIYLEDLEKMTGFSLVAGDYRTLTGYIHKHLGRIPIVGETIRLPDCLIVVKAMEGHRMTQVSFERNLEAEDSAAGDSDA
jgi:CBS domain containing-hemolysin-like protein